jgi:hypothetical protein
MESRIVIFLAFTSVALIFNSLVIWLAYKALADVTAGFTETLLELEKSSDVRSFLQTLEKVSLQAISVTETGKRKLAEFEPALAAAQSKYGFRLAQVDVQCERSLSRIQHEVGRVQDALVLPIERIGATLAGVEGILGYLSAEQSDADANPRLNR